MFTILGCKVTYLLSWCCRVAFSKSICIKQDGYGTVAGKKIEVQPGVNHECQSGAFPTEPLKLLEGCYMEDCYSIWRVAFFSAYGGLVLTINDTRFSLRLKLCLLP